MTSKQLIGKYVCLDCCCTFNKSKLYVETHGLDTPPYERISGCPNCGGFYIKAIYCDCCGGVIVGDYAVIEDGNMYCDGCYSIKDITDTFY